MHRRNYAMLRAAGAREDASALMRFYYVLNAMLIPCALLEQLALAPRVDRTFVVLGMTLVLAGVGLRFWAITSLGHLWTMRCLTLPGMRPLGRGPYRRLHNPEYISRLMDGAGLCLVFGARWTLLVFLVILAVSSRLIVRVEQRQLATSLGQGHPRPAA
jgi:methyltransferase